MNKKRNTPQRKASAQAIPPACAEGPTLLEFWHELQRRQREGLPLPSGSAASSGAASSGAVSSGAALSSAWHGSGSQYGSGFWRSSGSQRGSGSRRGSGVRSGSGSRRGSGSSGGSGGLGYGLGLILPDPAAQRRVMDIMRELCRRDAERMQKKQR